MKAYNLPNLAGVNTNNILKSNRESKKQLSKSLTKNSEENLEI